MTILTTPPDSVEGSPRRAPAPLPPGGDWHKVMRAGSRNDGITIRACALYVSDRTGVPVESIIGRSHNASVVAARHLAVWTARQYTGKTLFPIAKFFNRDHTTLLNSLGRIALAINDNGIIPPSREQIIEFMVARGMKVPMEESPPPPPPSPAAIQKTEHINSNRWTQAEISELLQMIVDGVPREDIVDRTGRSLCAIARKCVRLGVKKPKTKFMVSRATNYKPKPVKPPVIAKPKPVKPKPPGPEEAAKIRRVIASTMHLVDLKRAGYRFGFGELKMVCAR